MYIPQISGVCRCTYAGEWCHVGECLFRVHSVIIFIQPFFNIFIYNIIFIFNCFKLQTSKVVEDKKSGMKENYDTEINLIVKEM